MRNPQLYFASAVVAAGLFIGGCDNSSNTPATPAAPTTPAAPAAPAAGSIDMTQVKAQLAKVQADVANKDWTSADTDLKPLEAEKDQLAANPDIQAGITQLRTAINAGKGLSLPTSMPSMPSMPGMGK